LARPERLARQHRIRTDSDGESDGDGLDPARTRAKVAGEAPKQLDTFARSLAHAGR
jgi:hypothetical protein